jgi:hypothetical protein
MNPRWLAGTLTAPCAGLLTGVWAEFAELGPPALLAVTVPAIVVSLLSLARLTGRTGPRGLVLVGAALGLLTFSTSAGVYIALHLLRGGGLDVNGEEAGGSAAVFFAVHVAVGALVGVAVGLGVAALAFARHLIARGRVRDAPKSASTA